MCADLRMQVRPGAHSHRPVARVLACVLRRGFGPGAWVRALHLRTMAAWASGGGGRASEARIGVEATPRSQTDEDLARTPLQSLLHLDGIVARVEDEQGSDPLLRRPAQERVHLLGGPLVGVLRGAEALPLDGD